MKGKRLFISLLLMTAFFAIVSIAESSNVELNALDVNCRSCHTDPHPIHSKINLQCEKCHGETLNVRIPQCTTCHKGPIHEVHKEKVNSQPCSSCHKNIQGKHNSLLGDSICEHCHKDLITIHGGEIDACTKCHGSAAKITKPIKTQSMVVVCENCHQAESVATIHGSKDDSQTCYRCHREGVEETETTKIPHIIHVPKVDCMTCHWDLNEDTITVPQCSRCHSIDKIHAFGSIGKTMKGSVECSICHPDLSVQKNMGEVTEIVGKPSPTKIPDINPTSTPPLSGFSLLTVLLVIGMLFVLKTGFKIRK